MKMRKNKSVIYTNYSPYENSGKILDYLLETFHVVVVFSIGFYSLANKKNYNYVSVYKNGKLQKTYRLFHIPISSRFVFLFIPIRSFLTFVEIISYSFLLKLQYKKFDVYFTANAFTAWIGNLLKIFGVVDKTVFWVWDYYPPIHKSKFIMLIRYMYWQFDKASSHSDIVAFVNQRLLNLRLDIGLYSENSEYLIIPIGTDKLQKVGGFNKAKPLRLGFIGVLKKSQGLEIVFMNEKALLKKFDHIAYEIVGSGPDENYFKEVARKSKIQSRFYGYLEGDSFNSVLNTCAIGIATYTSDVSNVSQYGDPGKIKRYLSLGIPVITTNILEFAKEIEASGAGVIIDYDSVKDLTHAIEKITANYATYSANAYTLGQKFYYKKIYPKMFAFKK